ncbi:hypothetical protein Krac_5494 [Ktedonobacter racemifer DSM 44963]|uniref:Uncharacterized protein n=1 Tax=Ktedonobacter racemifer DSM 44963 TaxID=485913 RepID=D6TW68_KTERA|nr:hypothetical protein Krac_5494 [Ktedonobacter racemifer DSM 44963]
MRNAEEPMECLQHQGVLGTAGEPDTEKLVRPVRWETHRNLIWKQIKALCVHPIASNAEKPEGMYSNLLRKSCMHGETVFVEPKFPPAFGPPIAACLTQ